MTRRRTKASPEFRNHLRRWDLDDALDRYYRRWLDARDRIVEKCIADVLGHAREHDARDFYAGIDRTTSPQSLLWSRPTEPFSFATFQEAVFRIMSAPVLPPVKPWLFKHRFEQLVREGIPAELIKRHFEIY